MQVIDNFGKVLLRFVLARNVRKLNAVRRLHVHLRTALAHVELHGVRAAHFLHELPRQKLSQHHKEHNRQHPAHDKAHQRGHLLHNLAGKLRAGIVKALYKAVVIQKAGFINFALVLICEQNLVVFNLHLTDFFALRHLDERAIVHFLHLVLCNQWHHQHV